MPVTGLTAFALDVPSLDEGVAFYTDAGLDAQADGRIARFRCAGQSDDCVLLYEHGTRKRLNHIRLRATDLGEIAERVPENGGSVVSAPADGDRAGLWVCDPHGTLFHLVDGPPPLPLPVADPFLINAPGRIVRVRQPGVRPLSEYGPARPLRLGHAVLFTPDVVRSVAFVTSAFGMGLADRSEDVVAFCCTRKDSDHHVLAFGKSDGIGFHHASFQCSDPDEVGRAGRALATKAGQGDWGFGRHSIGSNFFHYIRDPWGSWFEYYSDMDHIDDYSLWSPTNYALEDSLSNWAPLPPDNFGDNLEIDAAAASSKVGAENAAHLSMS